MVILVRRATFAIFRKSSVAKAANPRGEGESGGCHKWLKYGQFQMMMHGFALDFRSARL